MDNLHWNLLSSEYLNRHIYFTARRDRCQRQDGVIVDPYFVVELPTAATAFALTEDNQVLLLRQYRHPIGEVVIETPGGFVDEGEDFETAMKRELMEETGYAFTHVQYLGRTAANPGVLNNYTQMYMATGGKLTGKQKLDHNEELDLMLVSLEELTELVKRQEIRQSTHMTCILFALMKLGRLHFG